jgi:hypothetical protein
MPLIPQYNIGGDYMRIRNKVLYVYLSEAEQKALENKMKISGLNASALIRHYLTDFEIKARPPDDYFNLLKEINAIGTNINQIAHIANSERTINNDKLDKVMNLLDAIMEKVCDFE